MVQDELPQYPEEVEYLRGWIYELHGRSGAAMGGLQPLAFSELEAWWRLKGFTDPLTSLEIEALILLDGCLLYPEAVDDDDVATTKVKRKDSQGRVRYREGTVIEHPAWPERQDAS